MSLQIRYNRVTTAAGVQPDTITARQNVAFSSSAEEGSVAQSQLIVDDTSNALNYVGLRRVYAYETRAQAHNQIVFNGYLAERTIGRQPAEGQDSDEEVLGRRWSLSLADTNSLMSRRLITGSDGNRPAETDIARIQWLLDSNDKYLSNPHDTWANPSPFIDTSGAVAMDAADLRGQTAFDVLNDCAQRSGKNWFAQYYEAADTVPPTNAGSIALHYYTAESTYNTSTLRLSNVNGDADNLTTFAVLPDAILTRDPSRVYSGMYVQYDGGELYQQSTTVENLFQRRDAAVSNPNIKTAAKASALATRYLADAATEDDRITCRFIVPAAKVNDLREGQRLQARFSHFSGYSSYSYMRCLRRTVTQYGDDHYEIAVELSPAPCTPSIARAGATSESGAGNHIFPFTPAAGKLLIFRWDQRNGGAAATFTGWTQLPNYHNAGGAADSSFYAFWKIADGTETHFDVSQVGQNQYGYLLELDCGCGTTLTNNLGAPTPMAGNDCGGTYTLDAVATTVTGPAMLMTFWVQLYDWAGTCVHPDLTEVSPWTIY